VEGAAVARDTLFCVVEAAVAYCCSVLVNRGSVGSECCRQVRSCPLSSRLRYTTARQAVIVRSMSRAKQLAALTRLALFALKEQKGLKAPSEVSPGQPG